MANFDCASGNCFLVGAPALAPPSGAFSVQSGQKEPAWFQKWLNGTGPYLQAPAEAAGAAAGAITGAATGAATAAGQAAGTAAAAGATLDPGTWLPALENAITADVRTAGVWIAANLGLVIVLGLGLALAFRQEITQAAETGAKVAAVA